MGFWRAAVSCVPAWFDYLSPILSLLLVLCLYYGTESVHARRIRGIFFLRKAARRLPRDAVHASRRTDGRTRWRQASRIPLVQHIGWTNCDDHGRGRRHNTHVAATCRPEKPLDPPPRHMHYVRRMGEHHQWKKDGNLVLSFSFAFAFAFRIVAPRRGSINRYKSVVNFHSKLKMLVHLDYSIFCIFKKILFCCSIR
jgi:hypothetical protein